jgi:hypothetical protein
MRKLKHITEICAEIYEKEGFTAVCEYANKILESESLMKSDIAYEYCKGCDTDTPAWRHNCLVCGQTTEPHYFKVVHTGFCKASQREEIQIHAGKHGNILIYQDGDKLGFIVDVYGENDVVDTMTVWEDDLTPLPDEDDELDNADITDEDIVQFKKDWGQTHSGVTAELGYPRSHEESDGLLMEDFFWIEKDKRWYNKCASGFTEKEQRIADYLRNLN